MLNLWVKLEGSLCLVYEFVLHLQSIYDINDLALLDDVTFLLSSRVVGRHLKLLDLVQSLVDFPSLIHEILKLWHEKHMVLLDPLSD